MGQRWAVLILGGVTGIALTNAFWAAGRPDHQADVVGFTCFAIVLGLFAAHLATYEDR